MFKVFLVDDEIVVREGIRTNFPWEQTEFVLAGEAPDGEIALNMLQDVKPDILITDIRMPFMDGLELCRQVSRSMPWVHTVILSGYDDFSYAREAISLNVKEYLLKPVSSRDLLDVLQRIARQIREEQRHQADLSAYRQQAASTSRFQMEKLLVELYGGANDERILKSARTLQVNLLANRYLVMLLGFRKDEENETALLPVQTVLEQLTEGSGGTVQLCRGWGGFVFLVLGDSAQDLEERAYGLAQAVQYEVERNLNLSILIAIGDDVAVLKEVPKSLFSAQVILERLRGEAARDGAHRIMSTQDYSSTDLSGLSVERMDSFDLTDQLRCASAEEVGSILSAYERTAGESASQSIIMIHYFFVEAVKAASKVIQENGGVPQEVIPSAFRVENQQLSPENAMALCRGILEQAIRFRDRNGSARYRSVIHQAQDYIARHYADPNITLRDVASHVALSNNHFCTVFSQEMGITFTEYLTAQRVAKARELLASTDLRTSEISDAVGYNDPHYFSYQFKKQVGVSPRDYRKGQRNEGAGK